MFSFVLGLLHSMCVHICLYRKHLNNDPSAAAITAIEVVLYDSGLYKN